MAGQDHLLSKAFLTTGSAAYVFGQCVVAVAGTTLDPNQMVQATTTAGNAQAPTPLGLVQENIDLVKVQTGKAQSNLAASSGTFGAHRATGSVGATPIAIRARASVSTRTASSR